MKYTLIVLIVVMCFSISCKKSDLVGSGTTIFPDTLIPLKVNNVWNYNYQRYNYLNEVTYTSDTTVLILKDTILFGLKRFKFNTFFEIHDEQFWYRQSAEGFQVAYDVPGFKDSAVYFSYPPKLGFVYGRGIKWTITSLDTTIITSAGVYTCIAYQYIHQIGPIEYFVCPGIGIIKINEMYKTSPGEINYPGFRLSSVYTLKSYSHK